MSFPQIAGIHVDLIKAKWIPAFAGMTPCDFSRYPEESHGYWAFRHARPRVRLDGPPGLPVTKRHRRPLATLKCNHRGDLIFQSWPISEFALSQSARSAQFYEGDVSFHEDQVLRRTSKANAQQKATLTNRQKGFPIKSEEIGTSAKKKISSQAKSINAIPNANCRLFSADNLRISKIPTTQNTIDRATYSTVKYWRIHPVVYFEGSNSNCAKANKVAMDMVASATISTTIASNNLNGRLNRANRNTKTLRSNATKREFSARIGIISTYCFASFFA